MSDRPELIVGLGNPGPAYHDTRHNVGQAVVDRLAQRVHCRFRLRGQVAVAEAAAGDRWLHLVKPVAFMNVVGGRVARLLEESGSTPSQLIVVHDDLDLPFGRVRVRQRGGHGGHNGVRSLIEALETEEFRRVKVGIGRPPTREEVVDWVLAAFTPEEQRLIPVILDRAADAVLGLAAGPA